MAASDCGCASGQTTLSHDVISEGTVFPGDVLGEVAPMEGSLPMEAGVVTPSTAPAPTPVPTPAPANTAPAPADDAATPSGEDEPLFDENQENGLFNETPANAEPAAGEQPNADDLFPPAEEATPPAGNEPPAPAKEAADELDNLFGTTADSAPRLVSLREQPWRIWTDNTGWYETRGQLVRISHEGVRILKDNGHHCTVPFHRLSSADIQLVLRIAHRVGGQGTIQFAGR